MQYITNPFSAMPIFGRIFFFLSLSFFFLFFLEILQLLNENVKTLSHVTFSVLAQVASSSSSMLLCSSPFLYIILYNNNNDNM